MLEMSNEEEFLRNAYISKAIQGNSSKSAAVPPKIFLPRSIPHTLVFGNKLPSDRGRISSSSAGTIIRKKSHLDILYFVQYIGE